jgi:thiol-disulfide isomerase/thioredoxin
MIHLALPVMLLTRAFWALAIIAAGLALYRLLNRAILYRAQKNGAPDATQALFSLPGVPAILYFTTPDCVACKTVQRPALERLKECLGDRLQVVEINAQEKPDLASRWGVLSVPTTFIIDERGQLRHVNHGAARADKLLQQLEGVVSIQS